MAAPTLIPRSSYYDGPVTESDRANGMGGVPDFTVYGQDELRLSAHPTIPFALTVSKGKASAFGVTAYVQNTDGSPLVLRCDPNSTGTRWDIIVLRYDWRQDLGGPTDIRAINAGGKQIPTNLEKTPGSIVDQPTWLVRWTGNASAPAEYVDLRCFAANGGMAANDRLALGYLAKPGASVRIADRVWEYVPIGNGQWDWRASLLGDSGWTNLARLTQGFVPYGSPSGPNNGWTGVQLRTVNGWGMVNGAVSHPTRWGDNAVVAVIPGAQGPSTQIQGQGCVVGRSQSGGTWDVKIPAGTGAYSFFAIWPLG